MQFARCMVRLSGDAGTVIAKAPVSPAEVLLLRAIHGPDAVENLKLMPGNDRAPHGEEMARLRELYTAQDESGFIVNRLFPGANPRLPVKFSDVGIDLGDDEPAEGPDADINADGRLSVAELKAALKDMNVTVKGNPSHATLLKMYDEALFELENPPKDDEAEE